MKKAKQARVPKGWDEERVQKVVSHYETQSEDEAVAEDEAPYEETKRSMIEVPVELVSAVRELIARHQG